MKNNNKVISIELEFVNNINIFKMNNKYSININNTNNVVNGNKEYNIIGTINNVYKFLYEEYCYKNNDEVIELINDFAVEVK